IYDSSQVSLEKYWREDGQRRAIIKFPIIIVIIKSDAVCSARQSLSFGSALANAFVQNSSLGNIFARALIKQRQQPSGISDKILLFVLSVPKLKFIKAQNAFAWFGHFRLQSPNRLPSECCAKRNQCREN